MPATIDHQLISFGGSRLHPLGNHRTDPAIDDEAQAVNSRAPRGKPVLIEDLASGVRPAQNFQQQLPEFHQPGLTTLFEQVVQPIDHVRPPVFFLASSFVLPAECKAALRGRSEALRSK